MSAKNYIKFSLLHLDWLAAWFSSFVLVVGELSQLFFPFPACLLCGLQRWILSCFVLTIWLWFWFRPTSVMRWIFAGMNFLFASVGLLIATRQIWLITYGARVVNRLPLQCLSNVQNMVEHKTWPHILASLWHGGQACAMHGEEAFIILPILSSICFFILVCLVGRMIFKLR